MNSQFLFATGIENSNPTIHNGSREAVQWLWKQWANVLRIRNDGVPIIGLTWYSLTDQVDWDITLRESNGTVNPLGLYDLDRNIRPVGTAYKEIIRNWQQILPTHTQGLFSQMPIVMPRENYQMMSLKD